MTDQWPEGSDAGDEAAPETPPPQPFESVPSAGGVGTPGDLLTRFLARLIDHVILGVVIFAIVVPVLVAVAFTGTSANPFAFSFEAGAFVVSLVTAAITIGYFALMEANVGQTLGKMVLSLRTEGPAGGNPSLEQALRRNAWYALAIIPFLGGLAQLAATIYIAVTINNSAMKAGWHDEFAGGTRVIKTK